MKGKGVANCLWPMLIISVVFLLHLFPATIMAQEFLNISSLPNIEDQAIEKKVIRDFILYNYARLADDIVNGNGLYLDTLYRLLSLNNNQKEPLRRYLLKTLLEKKRIPEFSNCVAGYKKGE